MQYDYLILTVANANTQCFVSLRHVTHFLSLWRKVSYEERVDTIRVVESLEQIREKIEKVTA